LQKPIDNSVNINWESYGRGTVYALKNCGYDLGKVYPFHPISEKINFFHEIKYILPRLHETFETWIYFRV